MDITDEQLLVSEDHRKTLNLYLTKLNTQFYNADPERNYTRAARSAVEAFMSLDASPEVKEYVLANSISEELDFVGIEAAESRYFSFLEMYPDSKFSQPLKNRFAGWLDLAEGKPAPEFSGQSPDGNQVYLSDFLGKVVYIDIWASWCRPCLVEFPHAKNIKNQFRENDDVVFMYVSIDDEKDAWLNMLNKIPDFNGVHIMSENAWRSQIAQDYIIKGIPRYMLINKDGTIANVNANRPSSGEVLINDIRGLLGQP